MIVPKRYVFHTFVLLFLFIGLTASANAAIVHLKDGTQVNGTIVSATANNVQVFSDGKTIDLASDKIERIDYDPAPPPPPTGTRRYPRRSLPPREPVDFNDMRQMFSFNLGLDAPLSRVDFSSVGGGSADNGDAGILIGGQYLYFVN